MTAATGRTRPSRFAVVGGANTDIVGLSARALVPHDSNPGQVRVSAGGVARNAAENLTRLGAVVELVTVFGGDENAARLADECRAVGIGVDHSPVASALPGPVYLAIMDERGELALAVNDMRALESLTPEVLEARRTVFESADAVVADANLAAGSLMWLAEHVTAPLLVDPVSVAKAVRVSAALPRLAAVTPNALEAGVLLGRDVRNRDHAQAAARDLVALGVGAAFVTCGPFGVAWADSSGSGLVSAPPVERVLNATGAGDAFAAGVAYGLARGWAAAETARFASALATFALTSELTVSESVSPEAVAALQASGSGRAAE